MAMTAESMNSRMCFFFIRDVYSFDGIGYYGVLLLSIVIGASLNSDRSVCMPVLKKGMVYPFHDIRLKRRAYGRRMIPITNIHSITSGSN
jgi:hypothetical protein